jgi:hypothetical protein
MTQPKHRLNRLLALNANGLHELMGSVTQRYLANRRSFSQSRPARRRGGQAVSVSRKLWCTPRASSKKNGAIQVPGLGLEMRGLAKPASQDTGSF